MHGQRRADDLAAIGLAERLMAETDAKNRDGGPGGRDEVEANAGVARPARSGRQHDRVGRGGDDLGNAHLVVAVHADLGAERAEAMHQVPGEAVVIVDERDGGHARRFFVSALFWAAPRRRSR